MIRAFITTWSIVDNHVVNPIVDYVDTLSLAEPITCNMYYPDADANGIPDKPYVLVIVKGPVGIEQLKNLAGVKMIPAYGFNTPVSEIPSAVKTAIKDEMVSKGVPLSAFADVVVYGDFLKRLAKYFSVGFNNFRPLSDASVDWS